MAFLVFAGRAQIHHHGVAVVDQAHRVERRQALAAAHRPVHLVGGEQQQQGAERSEQVDVMLGKLE